MRLPFRSLRRSLLAAGIVLAGAPLALAQAPLVDGSRDAVYGAPLAVQGNPTGFGNSTQGSQLQANGSELDAVYGRVNMGMLYLLFTGNLESNGNKLELFFDTRPGGQNVLLGTNPNVDGDGLNRMAGLTFDAGFEADYYLSANIVSGTATAFSAYYATLNAPTNVGAQLVSGGSTNLALTFPSPIPSGEIGLDNSNVAGVSGGAVGNPGAVTTGIELAIPLAALGTPTANFRICAFINGQGHDFVSNQVLGALPNGLPNPGDPTGVSFALLPGGQSVLVPVGASPPARALLRAVPGGVIFAGVGTGTSATQEVRVLNVGGAPLTLSAPTITNARFSTTAGARTIAPGDSATLPVRFSPTAPGTAIGTLTLASNDPNQPTVDVPLLGTGVTPSTVTVDGTLDATYGTALALQTTPTGFGNNQSELNGAYAHIANGKLYLMLTGNLEANGNPLEVFFDTQAGGQNALAANNPAVDGNALGTMAGMHFDAGFAPDYYLTVRGNGAGAAYTLTGGYASLTGAAGTGTTLTSGTAGVLAVLDFGSGATGSVAVNNANTGGVSDVAVNDPSTVTTGIELEIPLAAIGSPSGNFRVAVMVNGGGHTFMSNQVLAGLPNGTPNLGTPSAIDFTTFAGDQFFTVPNTVPVPGISATPDPLAIGNVTVGSAGTGTLTVANPGTGPLTIVGIVSSNPLFSVTPTTGTVAAGGSLALTVTFAPTAAGAQTGTLTIASNASGQPTTNVTVTGTGVAVPTPLIAVTPASLNLGAVATGGSSTGVVTVANTGTAPLTITGIVPGGAAFAVNPTTGTIAPGDSLLITVTFSPTAVGAVTGTMIINSNAANVPAAMVTLSGTGITPPTTLVDGSLDANYGAALALQTTPTGFGDANQGTPTTANGSELDAAYARIDNGTLYLLLTGNLQSNGNKLELFFDTGAGGQNVLAATGNPNVDGDALATMAGLTFDSGFAPDYYLTTNATTPGGALTMAAHFATLTGGPLTGMQLGTGPGTSINLDFGGGNTGALGLNNVNTAGVTDTTLANPAGVTTGIEFAIPLAALGNPTGPIRVSAFINGQNHDFASNQILGGLPLGTGNLGGDGAGNFTGTLAGVNFNSFAGNQFFTIPTTAAVANVGWNVFGLNLGTTGVGVPVTGTITLQSTGTAPLVISSVTSSNPMFTVSPASATVQPGDSLVLTITFTPTVGGNQSGTLTVSSNAQITPSLQLALLGNTITGLPTALAGSVALFPNPAADGTATLRLTGAVQLTADVVLLDALGREVRRLPAAPTTVLTGLTPGVYTLRLPTNYGPVTRRLVVR